MSAPRWRSLLEWGALLLPFVLLLFFSDAPH
jgi:hypothetical protein